MLTPKQSRQPNNLVGQQGEARAVTFLTQNGYRIVDTNCQLGSGEVDIVAFDEKLGEIVFVEVKTRSHEDFGNGSAAVNQRKLRSLTKVAVAYLRSKHLNADFRFDVICVLPDTIEHYENVTW